MNNFRIFETEEFTKSLKKLTAENTTFIQKKLKSYVYPQIKREPCFGTNIKKLRNYNPDTCRYRLGKFRLFYTVDHKNMVVYILTIEFQKDAY